MTNYTAIVNVPEEHLAEEEFRTLLRKTEGAALSYPLEDDPVLGKAHLVSFQSPKKPSLTDLTSSFHEITVSDLQYQLTT